MRLPTRPAAPRLMPRTLFGRTAGLLLLIFALTQGIALWVVWRTVAAPLAVRSADELAARMVLAAQTWVELPPAARVDYEIELSLRHGLELGRVAAPLATPATPGYFGELLAERLSARTGRPVVLKRGQDGVLAWVELPMAGYLLRLGFRPEHYALEAPLASAGVFLAGAALTLLAALLMARRTTGRLRRLVESAAEVGEGRVPEPLPEDGPEELRKLSAAFNRMSTAVQSLLENRTVLLAGISHDLRTPLTRLRLALSLLEEAAPERVRRMEADLEEMNRLIGDMLGFARALKPEAPSRVDLAALLGELAAGQPERVRLAVPGPCPVLLDPRAVRRIVENLLGNALRYGGEAPVDLELRVTPEAIHLRVLDRGPGIPATEREAVFRPFHRLEHSRARDTGGAGLGLAIARQLADAHGWRIRLDERPGGGLAAELSLPAGAAVVPVRPLAGEDGY